MNESDLATTSLIALGVPSQLIHLPLTGGMYLENSGGIPINHYWPGASVGIRKEPEHVVPQQRAEAFLVANSVLAILTVVKDNVPVDRQIEFDCFYMYLTKGFAQSLVAIDATCQSKCYLDAFRILRSLHGQVYLLLLFALGPHLFDKWLKDPKNEIFLDGAIRRESSKYGLHIYPHLYEEYSEIVHGQHQAQKELGFMVKGLFPEIVPIANRVYVTTKLLFGVIGWIGMCYLSLDYRPNSVNQLADLDSLWCFFQEEMLAPNRSDHLFTTVAVDRHWNKVGKNKWVISEPFNYKEFKRQIGLFHRDHSIKLLSSKYR